MFQHMPDGSGILIACSGVTSFTSDSVLEPGTLALPASVTAFSKTAE